MFLLVYEIYATRTQLGKDNPRPYYDDDDDDNDDDDDDDLLIWLLLSSLLYRSFFFFNLILLRPNMTFTTDCASERPLKRPSGHMAMTLLLYRS